MVGRKCLTREDSILASHQRTELGPGVDAQLLRPEARVRPESAFQKSSGRVFLRETLLNVSKTLSDVGEGCPGAKGPRPTRAPVR